MSDDLLSADSAPGSDVLLPIIETLYREALTASTYNVSMGRSIIGFPRASYRERRGHVLYRISAALEHEIGLRPGPARTPFCATFSNVENGDPLGGYIGEVAGYPVPRWLGEFFARWEGVDAVGASWQQRGNTPDQVDHNTAFVEGARLTRAALWHVFSSESRDAVRVAVQYVVELTATGQARSLRGAALAIAWLLRCAGEDSGSPVDLAAALFGGRAPDTLQEWVRKPLSLPELRIGRLSNTAQRAVSWLVQYTWATVERTRAASDLDEWFIAVASAGCITGCVHAALGWVAGEVPLGLRATRSQFSELNADCSPWLAMFFVDASGMPAVVRLSRDMADDFRRRGDTSGQRFARERLLIPRPLVDSEHPLPARWRRPTWRLAVAWFHDAHPEGRHTVNPRAGDGAHQERVDAVDAAISETARLLPAADGPQDSIQIADALLDRFPWDAAVHHWHSRVSISSGNPTRAVSSATAAIVLQPEKTAHWQLLMEVLRRRGDTAGADTVRRVADVVVNDGGA
jgi:hypothetical protein